MILKDHIESKSYSNVTELAKLLKISRNALYEELKKHRASQGSKQEKFCTVECSIILTHTKKLPKFVPTKAIFLKSSGLDLMMYQYNFQMLKLKNNNLMAKDVNQLLFCF